MDQFDLNQTKRFLEVLAPGQSNFTFQVFDDLKSRKDNSLAETIYGNIDELAPKLIELNKMGCGVYVAVNEVKPNERRLAENVTRIRAFFMDKDDGPLTMKPKLEPTMIVNGARGPHYYYLLDQPIEVKSYNNTLFSETQKRMAKYFSSDEAISDLPRVMRLPGFYHMKDPKNPIMITFDSISGSQYDLDSINDMLPQLDRKLPLRKFIKKQDVTAELRGEVTDPVKTFLNQTWEQSRGDNTILVHAIANIKKNNFTFKECVEKLEGKGEELDMNTLNQVMSIYNDDNKYPIDPYIVKKNSWSDVLLKTKFYIDLQNPANQYGVTEHLMMSDNYAFSVVGKTIGGKILDKLTTSAKFDYNPSINAYEYNDDQGLPTFNMYSPPFWKRENFFKGVEIPKIETLPEPYDFFFKHMFDNDEESINYVLDWMANGIQGNRNIPILALVGTVRGLGKNVFGSINAQLHGQSNFQLAKQELISKEFNSQLYNKTFVQIDEAAILNSKDFETVKSYTNDFISIEGKGVNAQTCKLHSSILLTNNIFECLTGVSEKDDRQFSIPMIGKKPMLYHNRYQKEWERKQLFEDKKLVEQLAQFLYHRKVDNNKVVKNLKTDHYHSIIKSSKKEWERYILEDLYDRYHGCAVSFQDLKDAVRANESGRVVLGRTRIETLAKMYPHIISIARIKSERHIIYSKMNEPLEEFTTRLNQLFNNNYKNLQILDKIDRKGSVHE